MRLIKLRRLISVKWCHFWTDRSYKRRSTREMDRIIKQVIHFNHMVTAGKFPGRRYKDVVLGGRRY